MRKSEQLRHGVRRAIERRAPGGDIEHQPGKAGLETERRPHHPRADRAPVGREQDRDEQDERHAEQAEENVHGPRC